MRTPPSLETMAQLTRRMERHCREVFIEYRTLLDAAHEPVGSPGERASALPDKDPTGRAAVDGQNRHMRRALVDAADYLEEAVRDMAAARARINGAIRQARPDAEYERRLDDYVYGAGDEQEGIEAQHRRRMRAEY